MGKGFTVVSQKVSISIGLNGRIHGNTELTVVPTTADLKTVWLNARSLNVLSASLRVPTTVPLAFSHLPPAAPSLTNPSDIHTYPELKRGIWRGALEGEEGELGIAIPQGCVVKVPPPDGATPREEAKKEDEWEQIAIVVEYEVVKPGAGIVVVAPDEANPSRFPHVFTSALSDTAARTWVPCSDHAKDRCTWDLELIVPRVLYSGSSSRAQGQDVDMDGGRADDEVEMEWPVSAIASGELIEQVVHPDRSDRVIWHYAQVTPVSVQQIAWAVGPFVVTEIAGAPKARRAREGPEDEEEEEEELVEDEGPKLHALCLPGREAEMASSVAIIRQAMDYFTSTFGSYPFTTYTVAFIDSLASGAPTFHSAAMTLLSSDLLHPPSVIDQAYETRHLLAHALAVQWSGINIIPRTPSDTWLVVGIALHLTSLFLKTIWGNNEYRFRIKKDMIRCVGQDVQREPISVPARLTQPEPAQLQFIALKAPLVLFILDKHLRNAGTSLGLDKVLPKLFLDAITGELGSTASNLNTLSTNSFMRTCRKACGGSGDSLKTFFDQWVYGSGCPTFVITATFNRKKMAVELNIKQECLAYNWAQNSPWEEHGHLRPISLFEGQMTMRIHEADGTPYEHVLNISEAFKRHEVPFNTKYKRVRRNTKRYQARQAAATAAASGDAEAQEDVALIDVGFSLNLWEDEKEREKWRVADWTEEDDSVMSQATYEWIRIDADLDWIAGVQFEQPDFMWLSQLQRDRDVVAQLEAVHALSRMPSAIVSSNLAKTVLVNNYFIRVRMEAALALISCATKTHDFLGLFHLFKIFQTHYCFEPDIETHDPFGFRCIPKTNDFSDFSLYFLKKTLLTAISSVRDEKGQTPPAVHQFLVDLLAYNDNLGNKFSDTFYLTAIMNALGHSLVAVAPREMGQFADDQSYLEEIENNEYLAPAIAEVERYMSADRLVPSYHNAITVAGLEFKLKLTLANLIPEDRMSFFMYTRDGNYPPVRVAAFDALLLLNPLQEHLALARYFFSVLRDDSSRLVQRRLAQGVLESLPVLAAVQDLAAPELVFEEDGATKKEKDPLAAQLKALRKKPGRSLNFRQCLLQTLIHPDIDPEVRDTVLKICETTVKAGEEPIPKVRFRMPAPPTPAPIAESPAPTPATPGFPKLKFTSSGATPQTLPKITIGGSRSSMPTPLPYDSYEGEEFQPPALAPPKKVKIKAPPKPEQSQASGMTMSDVTACKSMIKKLNKEKVSLMFRAPVDPVKSGAPGYFDIIKNPMDISTMSAKLNAGQYPDRYAFRDDFKLIISNAIAYNIAGLVVELAQKLDAIFDKQWDRIEATLRAMETGVPAPKTPKAPKAAPPPPPPAAPAPYVPPTNYAPAPVPALPPPPRASAQLFQQREPPPPPPPAAAPAPAPAPVPDDLPPPRASAQLFQQREQPPPPPPLPAAPSSAPVQYEPRPPPPPPPAPYIPPVQAEPTPPPPPPPAPTTSFGLSFKLKPLAPPVPAPAPTPPPPPAPVPAEPAKPSGFKISFGGSGYGAGSPAPPPPPPAARPPKPHKIKVTRDYSDDEDDEDWGKPSVPKHHRDRDESSSHKHKKKKDRDRDGKEKHKSKKEVNYAEPEVPYLPPAALLPPRPEILDEPPLPHPSKWVKPYDPVDVKKAKGIISKVQGMREAFFFLQPVDRYALPIYYEEIAQPMDLQTMTRKLDSGQYRNYMEVFDDFDLIVANCKQFNTPNTEPIWHVLIIDRAWRAEWEKASKLSYNTKRSLMSMLKSLMKEGAAQPFLESINTIIEFLPTYFDIIPRGSERDLGTIRANLEKDVYTSIEALEADVNLMLSNCFRFNPPDNAVHKSGEELQKLFNAGISRIKSENGKKRAGDKVGGSSHKKAKY